MTPEQLAAIKARAAAAPPGPWTAEFADDYCRDDQGKQCDGWYVDEALPLGDGECGYFTKESAEFVAAARQDVPALVAEVERLRAALEKIADYPLHYCTPETTPEDYSRVCNACIYRQDDALTALMPPEERRQRGQD